MWTVACIDQCFSLLYISQRLSEELEHRPFGDTDVLTQELSLFRIILYENFPKKLKQPSSFLDTVYFWVQFTDEVMGAVSEHEHASPREAFADSLWDQHPTIGPTEERVWEYAIPVCVFRLDLWRAIDTTNVIESLNMPLRKTIKTGGHFPNGKAAIKLLRQSPSRKPPSTWDR